LDRREFLAKAGLAATWAGVSIRVSGCGGDEGGGDNLMDNGGGGDVTGDIDRNHGHTIEITESQLMEGRGVTLTLSEGTDRHTHSITLLDSEVMDIAAGRQVSKESTNDRGHTHTVTFN
jgi:hypothetical protein